jgi:hypothetical protein
VYLRIHVFEIQPRHGIEVTDEPRHVAIADIILSGAHDKEGYLQQAMFMVKATSHINSCRIWDHKN